MSKEQEQTNKLQEEREQTIEFGSAELKTGQSNIHCLTIIGQIEGHQVLAENTKTTKYEHVIPQIAAIEESQEIDGLMILLNTVGGDIEAGLAIAELIAGMKKPTVSLVLGGRSLHRCTAGGVRQKVYDCAHCIHDHPSGPDQRYRHRRASNLSLF